MNDDCRIIKEIIMWLLGVLMLIVGLIDILFNGVFTVVGGIFFLAGVVSLTGYEIVKVLKSEPNRDPSKWKCATCKDYNMNENTCPILHGAKGINRSFGCVKWRRDPHTWNS